jgi:hypothetical protein
MEHAKRCACRPIPSSLRNLVPAESRKKPEESKTRQIAPLDPRFSPIVDSFSSDRQVTYGGKGFGSSGLKVNGRLFAMIASKGEFVVKLPKERVDELVRLKKGEYFDPGHGRLMKQWITLQVPPSAWIELAKEARMFVGSGSSR